MPLKKGSSRETVSHNIKEMVASGHKPKQAIAASLANARKYKNMAKGGQVFQEGDDESDESLHEDALGSVDSHADEGEAGEPINPVQDDPRGLSANVETQETLAKALQAAGFSSNNNSNDFDPDDSVAGSHMSKGGQVQSEQGQPLGNKPDLDWIDDGNGEPMSVQAGSKGQPGSLEHRPMVMEAGDVKPSGLSKEAQLAIDKRKKARKYGTPFDPK